MAKKKLPASKKPQPFIPSREGTAAVDDWLMHGGDRVPGPGRAIIEGQNPESVEPVFTGEWDRETGDPVLKPGKQKFPFETGVYNPGDLTEPGHPLGEHGSTGDFTGLEDFSPTQIQQLLDDIYGPKGPKAMVNRKGSVNPGGAAINKPLPGAMPGSMISIPGLRMPGSMVTLPGLGGPGAMINNPLPGRTPSAMVTRPPKVDRKTLLAQMARNQARANGHHHLNG